MSSKESADSGKDSIRSWLLRMGWKEWGVFLLLGILLLVAGLPVTRKNSKTAEDQNAEKTRLESRLEELLSQNLEDLTSAYGKAVSDGFVPALAVLAEETSALRTYLNVLRKMRSGVENRTRETLSLASDLEKKLALSK